MSSGRFFIKENQSKKGRDYIYNYLIIKDEFLNKYPIYLKFQKDYIEFNFYGQILDENNKDDIKEKSLFRLDYSDDSLTNNKLNDTLNNIFNITFPSRDNVFLSINKDSSYENEFHYSNTWLNSLGIINKTDNSQFNLKSFPKKVLLRELLLDFIFDLNFRDVFESDENYSNAKSKLNKNKYFQAISAKFSFYYQFHSYNILDKREFNLTNIELSKEYWLKLISSQNASEVIYFPETENQKQKSKNELCFWFDDVEEELKNVFKIDEATSNDKNQYSKWFIKNNSILSALSLIFSGKMKFLYWAKYLDIKHFMNKAKPMNYFLFGILLFLINIPILSLIYNINLPMLIVGNCNLVLVIIFLFIAIESGRRTESTIVPFRISMFNLIIILTSSWIIITKTSVLTSWLLVNNNAIEIIVIFILLFFAYMLLLNNEIEQSPNIRGYKYKFKALSVFLISLFFSINIYMIGSTLGSLVLLEKTNFLTEFWMEKTQSFNKSLVSKEEIISPNDYSEYDISFLDKTRLQRIKQIVNNNSISNKEKKYLFESLQYVKCKNSSNDFLSIYTIKIINKNIFIVYPLIFGQIALTLFLGIFIQIIIKQKPILS